jgi:Putative zinc-finger
VTCDEARLSLGAFALGSLDADEDAEMRAHVEDCPVCREEMREFEALPALLADLTIEEASGRVQPSPALYESLRARAAAEDAAAHAGRRRLVLAAAAGVAVVALGGATFAWQQVDHGPKTYSSSSTGPAHLAVQLKAGPSGTGMTVKVRGLPANEHCTLIAVGRGGTREVAGSWVATYDGEATVTGWTALSIPQLTQVLVVDETGKQLLGVNV